MDLAELGALADRLDDARTKRLAADKTAASLKSDENELKTQLITEMETAGLSSAGGKVAVINRSIRTRAIAGDWSEIHEYVRKNDAFDLLHKRLTDSAVLLRRDDGILIPGVSLMDYSYITYAKART